jgi:hypothetical protein
MLDGDSYDKSTIARQPSDCHAAAVGLAGAAAVQP